MAEPIDMGKARNAYARERDIFRRELQWALRQFDNLPLTFDIKTELRFRAADLKAERLEAYRNATKDIDSNQPLLVGNNLRIRSMANSEDTFNRDRLNRSKSPISRSKLINDDNDDVEAFIARNRSSRAKSGRSNRLEPSVPISKMTYNAHKAVNTNTHVLSFEHQLRNDIDVMITAIEQLTEQNRDTWLKAPHTNKSQYFTSRYDDTSYSINSYLPTIPTVPIAPRSSVLPSLSKPSTPLSSTIDYHIDYPSSSILTGTSTTRDSGISDSTSKNCSVRSYFDSYLENFGKKPALTPIVTVIPTTTATSDKADIDEE